MLKKDDTGIKHNWKKIGLSWWRDGRLHDLYECENCGRKTIRPGAEYPCDKGCTEWNT